MTVLETIWLTAAKNVAGLVAKATLEMAEVGTETLPKAVEQQIFKASGQYIENYRNRHGILKVLGMSKPASLESIYTTVQLLDADDILNFETVAALERIYRQGNRRTFDSSEKPRQAGITVANKEQYLTVLGGPGVGKSTFLKKIGLEALKGRKGEFIHPCISVFLELKRLDSDKVDIPTLITEEFKKCGFPKPQEFSKHALEKGKLLILLDGLDEVPTQNLTQAIRKIQDFVDTYNKNRFIASCRTAAYHGYFRRCTDVAIADFNESQMYQFIHNWFQSDSDKQMRTADKCWSVLKRAENASALELAKTPLLLTFICLVYNRSQRLPDNRSSLYKKALDILLEEWAAEKRLSRDPIYQGLHTDLEKVLLSEIAYEKFSQDQLFFSRQEIVNQITKFLSETLDAPKHLDGKAILKAIELQQGILVERAEDVYSFSHLTIQEFLTARYVSNRPQLISNLIEEHLSSDRWREIFLLVSGLQDSTDSMLTSMNKKASNYIKSETLSFLICEIMKIAENLRGEHNLSVQSSVIRAFVLTKVLTYMKEQGYVINLTHSQEVDRALAQAQALEQALAQTFSLELNLDFNKARTLPLDRSRSLDFSLSTVIDYLRALSPQALRTLADYSTSFLVIVKCKQSAIRVSPSVWHSVEKNILHVEH